MSRATRIALDLALVSLSKIRPAVSQLWCLTKSAVVKTKAKPLVSNIVVTKVESALDKIAGLIVSALTNLRNRQLPREEKYLEKELGKVRQRMSGNGTGSSGGRCSARPALATAWQYAKVEMVPPMTIGFFHGPAGKALESTVAKSVDGFISGLQSSIRAHEEAIIKKQQEQEAAIKAAQEKAIATAKAKEAERKQADEEKRKQAEKEAKAKADAKAAEDAKKAESKKAEKPKETEKNKPKKPPPKEEKKK